MSNKTKMYATNSKVRKWLGENGFADVHFFPHTRFIKDLHFQGQDFDGIASIGLCLVLFQCKTNCKATKQTLLDYKALDSKYGIQCLWFNNISKIGLEVNNGTYKTM